MHILIYWICNISAIIGMRWNFQCRNQQVYFVMYRCNCANTIFIIKCFYNGLKWHALHTFWWKTLIQLKCKGLLLFLCLFNCAAIFWFLKKDEIIILTPDKDLRCHSLLNCNIKEKNHKGKHKIFRCEWCLLTSAKMLWWKKASMQMQFFAYEWRWSRQSTVCFPLTTDAEPQAEAWDPPRKLFFGTVSLNLKDTA